MNSSKVRIRLSLGELRSTTSGLETVLLSLLHTRVAGEQAGSLESSTILCVNIQESAGNTVTDCACLAGDTAAGNVCNDVKLAGSAGNAEGLVDDELQGLEAEVIIDGTAVDGDLAGAGVNTDTSDGLLSAAGAVEVGLCTGIHNSVTFLSLIRARKPRASEPRACERRLHRPSGG